MSRFRLILGAPLLDPAGLAAPRVAGPATAWFSVARHALLAYLDYLGENRAPASWTAVPEYMCHEVIGALRGSGREVRYYPVEPDLSVDPARLDSALEGVAEGGVLVAVHSYGRLLRNLADISRVCDKRGLRLIEDCAHLPYPFPGPSVAFVSEARLYSFRKVFGVPHGAAVVLREGQAGFEGFAAGRLRGRSAEGTGGVLRWLARDAAKRLARVSGLPWRRCYRDLSQDPPGPLRAAHPWVRRMVSSAAYERCVGRRRENYRAYSAFFDELSGWAEPLFLEPETDVPYQLLLRLKGGVGWADLVGFLLANGVSAVRGIALHPDVLSRLGEGHPFAGEVALPLHQDVDSGDVERVRDLLRRFRRESR